MKYTSLNHVIVANDRDVVRVFLRHVKDDKFYEMSTFR